jgi:AhpD family alkylhydroperoxidase
MSRSFENTVAENTAAAGTAAGHTDAEDIFPEHTIESAPPASRRHMTATAQHLGYLPSATARWAASPELLEGFGKLNALFEATTLSPLAREVLVMTIATRHDCHVCVAMHTGRLTALGADTPVITALRGGTAPGTAPENGTHGTSLPLTDPALEAVRLFTLRVLDSAGAVGDDALSEFLTHGYTPRNALEIVLGIGTLTMSTLANRLTGAPVDEPLAAFA